MRVVHNLTASVGRCCSFNLYFSLTYDELTSLVQIDLFLL